MPTVQRSEVLHVVRELWGFKGASVDDQAKLVLAEDLIREAWEHNNKMGIAVNNAGTVIKAALGAQWMSAHDRHTQGKPNLRQLLGEDPYFLVRVEEGFKQPVVKLRISRLAKLIGNPELIEEYRTPADGEDASSSLSHPQPQGGSQAVTLTDDGLPIRPGQRPCKHYMKFGWCLFKQDCWYSHPPNKDTTKRSSSKAGAAGRDPPLFESELEPGVMLINGVYPMRPGKKICSFYMNNGWCAFKAQCRSHHPLPSELEVDQASLSRASTMSPDSSDGGYAGSSTGDSPQVKQPPLQVLLGVIIDSVWPPSRSPEACARGAVAKFMVELQADQVQRILRDRDAQVTVGGPQAGERLNKFWRQQRLYDPNVKPWGKAMANMLEEDPLFLASRAAQPSNTFTLLLGQLIEIGAKAASSHLSRMADIVWPPNSSKDAWLRGMLAKWLLQAGFEGNNGEVLRQVLSVGPGSPTVFRIDLPQAGEFLKRSWERDSHPYDKSTPPWTQLKPLIADDRFFYIEPAPGKPNSQHVTLDLLDLLLKFPSIARRSSSNGGMLQVSGAGTSSGGTSNGAGPSSSGAAAQAGPSSSSSRGDALNVEDYEDSGTSSNPAGDLLQASAAAAAAVGADGAADAVEADIAALETLRYAPPSEGMGARKLQRWWPRNKPDQQGWAWAEVAVRLLSPDDPDAALRVAEMVQHLEICPILGVACSAYAQRPHLLQFFAPYASIGGLEMPAAVYLLDLHRSGEHVRNYLSLVAPVLSSRDNIKVCHSSKQWNGLLYKAFGMQLNHYFDTQQANYVWKSLMRETSKRAQADVDLQRTAEVSLTALLENCGFYHPVRHSTDSGKLQWQNRPLTNELITCAAADVAYLVPLMETQIRTIRQAASEVRQHQSQQRGRAAQMLSSLPPELAGGSVIESLAQGVEGQQRGGLSLARLGEWASLNAFHQVPWHAIDG